RCLHSLQPGFRRAGHALRSHAFLYVTAGRSRNRRRLPGDRSAVLVGIWVRAAGLGDSAGERQGDLEGRPAAAGLLHLDMPTVRDDHRVDDRESQARSSAVTAAAWIGAVERLEDPLAVLG